MRATPRSAASAPARRGDHASPRQPTGGSRRLGPSSTTGKVSAGRGWAAILNAG
ncbi:hypothetical protein HNR40_005977 [Nonomuraea endophytica]|uniref:Uncharacterized protein n=1 Tax=Nonomuraea endophytica TaxID=714136 RepID=A0A7W8A6I3_9ACTN|nr:hypothetical protein [Nonomuraea endophytica]